MQTLHKYFQMFKEINEITSDLKKPESIGEENKIKVETEINYFKNSKIMEIKNVVK